MSIDHNEISAEYAAEITSIAAEVLPALIAADPTREAYITARMNDSVKAMLGENVADNMKTYTIELEQARAARREAARLSPPGAPLKVVALDPKSPTFAMEYAKKHGYDLAAQGEQFSRQADGHLQSIATQLERGNTDLGKVARQTHLFLLLAGREPSAAIIALSGGRVADDSDWG